MSRAYHLGCHDCRVYLWVGQGWPPDRLYLYSTDEHMRRLQEFFWNHLGHRLEYQDSETACWWAETEGNYQELYADDDEGKPPPDGFALLSERAATAEKRVAELEVLIRKSIDADCTSCREHMPIVRETGGGIIIWRHWFGIDGWGLCQCLCAAGDMRERVWQAKQKEAK